VTAYRLPRFIVVRCLRVLAALLAPHAVALALAAVLHISAVQGAARRFLAGGVLVLIAAAVIVSVLPVIRFARWYRELAVDVCASGGMVCSRCGYSLEDLPPEGACPECGADYSEHELRQTWLAARILRPHDVRTADAQPPSRGRT